jgi:UDP-N-acetylglucosamine acyltransferase
MPGMTVHPTALVSPDARLGEDVSIGPYAVVEDAVTVGDRTEIRAHAVVKRFTTLGADNRVHEGAVIGGEPQDLSFKGVRSGVVIGDRNVIREGVTIHRSTREGGATVVGSDCFLMAYTHLAHDNRLGDRVIVANNVALGGHVEVGDNAFLGGGALVHQFVRVGRLAMVGGGSGLHQDALPFTTTEGAPARAVGLNVVGLRRAGLTPAQRALLKQALRLLVRAGLPLEEALGRMAGLADPLVDEMAAFARASKRGFAHARRGAPDGA